MIADSWDAHPGLELLSLYLLSLDVLLGIAILAVFLISVGATP